MEQIERLLADIAELWNKIEFNAKQAEQFRGEAIVASINEMRYAGRRIVDFLVIYLSGARDDDKARVEMFEHLVVAKTYLHNADHDITDSICFFAHRRFMSTVEIYGLDYIDRYCPDFLKLYPRIKEVHEIIKNSRAHREGRREVYDELSKEYIPDIIKLYKLVSENPSLALKVRGNLFWVRRWARIIRWLVIISSVAAIASVIVSLLAWIYTWPEFKTLVSSGWHWVTSLAGHLPH